MSGYIPLFGFFGGVLKAPVLFNLSKEFIFHKTAVIITIKSYEGISYVYICHEHDREHYLFLTKKNRSIASL